MLLFNKNSSLNELDTLVSNYLEKLNLSKDLRRDFKKIRYDRVSDDNVDTKKTRAARTILHTWRKYKIRQVFEKNPYLTYLSWVNKEDEQRWLSSLMYGRRLAEFKFDSERRIKNPYRHHNLGYHRSDDLSGPLLYKLVEEMTEEGKREDSVFIPVTLLNSLKIEEVVDKLFPKMGKHTYKLIEDKKRSVGLIVVKKNNPYRKRIVECLTSSGLIASPWEISLNINNTDRDLRNIAYSNTQINGKLPISHEELLKDEIFLKLIKISKNKKSPTKYLSSSLIKILENLPRNMKNESIKRISAMIDMANTFYEYDYPKFSLIVYSIMHEVSLSLEFNKDEKSFKEGYKNFLKESKGTLCNALGINIDLEDKLFFLASPSISGTNAYSLATKIASKLKTTNESEPEIKMEKPSYFEFGFITKSTQDNNADIFLISTGPIVNLDGLTPGKDINKYIRRNFIQTNREKPAVLIVDASSSLYENLHLDEDVKKFVSEGKLSIIVIESHQKFGMLHSDQAQYGRMFALCSKAHFDEQFISKIMHDIEDDYRHHLDLRIGAFYSYTCGDILEEIKKQHFSNGALFRNMLIQTSLISKKVISHEDMLENFEKLYFATTENKRLKEASESVLDARDSYAHFTDTWANIDYMLRISASASDDIDCLIKSSQIYLLYYSTSIPEMISEITFAKEKGPFNLSKQIILLAIGCNLLIKYKNFDNLDSHTMLNLLFHFDSLMEKCNLLKGRSAYNQLSKKYSELKSKLVKINQVRDPNNFFSLLKKLFCREILLRNNQILELSLNKQMREMINLNSQTLSNSEIFTLLDFFNYLTEDQKKLMINSKAFSASIIEIHKAVQKVFSILEYKKEYQSETNKFLSNCFSDLESYLSSDQEVPEKTALSSKLKVAVESYSSAVLNNVEGKKTKAIRYILKGLINALAALTLGIAYGINYKITGNSLFFSGSASKRALIKANKTLLEKIVPIRKK